MGDGDEEERIAGVGNTGKGVVPWMLLVRVAYSIGFHDLNIPSSEGCDNTKCSTSSQKASVGRTTAVQQVCKAKEQECQVKGEEEGEEGDSRAKSADEQQEGEDEPTHEVKSERVEERRG